MGRVPGGNQLVQRRRIGAGLELLAQGAVTEGRRRLMTHSQECAGVAMSPQEAQAALDEVLAKFARWRRKK